MIIQRRGPYRSVPLFDSTSKSKGPRVDLELKMFSSSNTPYVAINGLAQSFKVSNSDIKTLLERHRIPTVQIKHGIEYCDFVSFDNFVEALATLPAQNNNVALLERTYIEAKSVAFRRRVFKTLDIPLDGDCYTPMKTTAGKYMCCGAYSFKPIAKASFE